MRSVGTSSKVVKLAKRIILTIKKKFENITKTQ